VLNVLMTPSATLRDLPKYVIPPFTSAYNVPKTSTAKMTLTALVPALQKNAFKETWIALSPESTVLLVILTEQEHV